MVAGVFAGVHPIFKRQGRLPDHAAKLCVARINRTIRAIHYSSNCLCSNQSSNPARTLSRVSQSSADVASSSIYSKAHLPHIPDDCQGSCSFFGSNFFLHALHFCIIRFHKGFVVVLFLLPFLFKLLIIHLMESLDLPEASAISR